MNQSDTPAKVRLNDLLGPLPATRYVLAREGDGYSDLRLISEPAYTEEQMRAYAAAAIHGSQAAQDDAYVCGRNEERERCAKLCEAEHVGRDMFDEELDDCDLAYNNAIRDCAAAIRGA